METEISLETCRPRSLLHTAAEQEREPVSDQIAQRTGIQGCSLTSVCKYTHRAGGGFISHISSSGQSSNTHDDHMSPRRHSRGEETVHPVAVLAGEGLCVESSLSPPDL